MRFVVEIIFLGNAISTFMKEHPVAQVGLERFSSDTLRLEFVNEFVGCISVAEVVDCNGTVKIG